MTRLSIVLGVLGLFATGAVVPYLNRWVSNWRPQHHWFLGLAALFPAWLIALLALLPDSIEPGQRAPLPRSVLLCSVTALFGVIFTEMAARQLDKRGYSLSPFSYWLLGVAGLVPAWVIALWILF
jgi:surface polysaccharide O-acyltransferase-like enzyme